MISIASSTVNRFKHIHDEIESRRPDLDHLLEESEELSQCAKKDDVKRESKALEARWEKLDRDCKVSSTPVDSIVINDVWRVDGGGYLNIMTKA